MTDFDSLTLALEDWFDTPLCDLPEALRQRVKNEFFPMPWEGATADQRRSVALQLDYQHDPATKQDQQFWWDFIERKHALNKQIDEWTAVATATAGESAQKEACLAELRNKARIMEKNQRQFRGDYYPARKPVDGANDASSTVQYVAFPKAMKLLTQRLDAMPEELAAWVFAGGSDGGLDAFLNANGLNPPPKFNFFQCLVGDDEFDYLSPLMACWFREDDIAKFEPVARYLTGKSLIERWSQYPEIQPQAFICAKIRESRLQDIHPILGLSQGTNSKDSSSPPLEDALFNVGDVEDIEAEDFGVNKPTNSHKKVTKAKGHLNHDPEMQKRANEIAAEKKKELKRSVTRNEVGKLLAKELGMDEETILRRIRKEW